MPVRFDEQLTLPGQKEIGQEQFTDEYSAGEVFRAAFELENTVGSLLAADPNLPNAVVDNPDFNPFDYLTEDEKADSAFSFNAALADNEIELNALRRQSARERKNRKILGEAGALGFASTFAAGIIDPINLIPVGGTAFRTYKTGGSVLSGAMAVGSVAAGSAAITEMGLHATQLERTFGESAINVGGAFLLGGALGGALSKLSEIQLKGIDEEIADSMNVEPKLSTGQDSVSAMRFTEEVQIKGKLARVLSKALAFDPLTRSLTNDLNMARQIATELAENPIDVDGAVGTAVETLIKQHEGKYIVASESHLKLYEDLQKELGGKTGLGRLVNRKGVSRAEFNELVAKEMRNPSENAIPQVKQSAKVWRAELYEPMKDAAVKAGLLDESVEVTTAVNYLNRQWNKEKLIAQRPKFIQVVSKWLEDRDIAEVNRAENISKELKKLNKEIDKINKSGARASKEQLAKLEKLEEARKKGTAIAAKDMTQAEYQDVAAQIYERIIGTPDGRLPYDWKMGEGSNNFPIMGTKLKGPLAQRVFDIDDRLVEDFLENDIERLGARYLQQIAPDIELTARFGDVEMSTPMKELELEKRDALNRAGDDVKRTRRIEKEYAEAVRDLAAMRDRIRGVYGMPKDPDSVFVRAGRAIRNLNYMRFMGGVVASSVPDVARTFAAEGFANTFKFGLKPLIKNLKTFKVSAAEAKRYGIGSNALFNRAELLADIADYTQGGTALERALQSGAQQFSNINLMNQWTVAMKQLHAVTMQNTVIDTLLKGKGGEKFYNRLRRLGIDRDAADRIAAELKKHSEKIDGAYLSNAKKWDDPELEKIWGGAIRKESDRVIIVPGQEKPLFMSTEMGKTFMQFRSFMFAATQRMLIAGIQGQEANYFGGMLALTALGAMSYTFKQWDAGREISTDPMTLMTEGIDRSGSLGMLMEINNTMEKLSGSNLGMRSILGVSQPASRYASRSAAEAFLGPTFGSFFSTTARVLGAAGGDYDWTESDTRALRRLLPYQNLTFLRQGFDKLEQSISE